MKIIWLQICFCHLSGMSIKNCVFLGKIVCHVSKLSNKEFVVSTQISAFLEVACITPNPQLYPGCQRKHDFLDKGEHNYREKRFLSKICGDSPPFTHPHFFSNSLLYMGLPKST